VLPAVGVEVAAAIAAGVHSRLGQVAALP
jgi:hypothetical protein